MENPWNIFKNLVFGRVFFLIQKLVLRLLGLIKALVAILKSQNPKTPPKWVKCELIELDIYYILYMPFNGAETSCSWWTRGMRMSIAKCSMTRATHRGGLGKVGGLAVSYGRLTPTDSCSKRHEQKMDWCYTTSALIIIFKRQRCGRQCSKVDPV